LKGVLNQLLSNVTEQRNVTLSSTSPQKKRAPQVHSPLYK
jgi:hypothetical protein